MIVIPENILASQKVIVSEKTYRIQLLDKTDVIEIVADVVHLSDDKNVLLFWKNNTFVAAFQARQVCGIWTSPTEQILQPEPKAAPEPE